MVLKPTQEQRLDAFRSTFQEQSTEQLRRRLVDLYRQSLMMQNYYLPQIKKQWEIEDGDR